MACGRRYSGESRAARTRGADETLCRRATAAPNGAGMAHVQVARANTRTTRAETVHPLRHHRLWALE
jgi:hypothetical protein